MLSSPLHSSCQAPCRHLLGHKAADVPASDHHGLTRKTYCQLSSQAPCVMIPHHRMVSSVSWTSRGTPFPLPKPHTSVAPVVPILTMHHFFFYFCHVETSPAVSTLCLYQTLMRHHYVELPAVSVLRSWEETQALFDPNMLYCLF